MRILIFMTALWSTSLLAQGEQGMTILEDNKIMVSDGSRIYIQKEELSIVPPEGWEVRSTVSGVTALFQMPEQKDDKIPRTIQIQAFSDSKYIDAVTAEEFAVELEEKFSESSTSINDYRLRSHIPINLENGDQAWLFYFGFSINGVELIHAHLLASSADRHYVLTYTDVAENFVRETAENDYLDIAWTSMTSLELPSKAPQRLGIARYMGFAFGVAAFLGLVFAFWRKKKAGKVYTQYAEGKIPTGFGSTMHETHLKDDEMEDVEVILHSEYDGDEHNHDDDLNFDDSEANISATTELPTSISEKKIG